MKSSARKQQTREATKMATIMHTISGRNFHGRYRLTLRGAAGGFLLSDAQARRYRRALCPVADCTCGGGYGEGPDRDSATVEEDVMVDGGRVVLRLVPAAEREAHND